MIDQESLLMLTTPIDEFDFACPPEDPADLATELLQVMNEHNGLGLSANQISKKHRVFVMRGYEENFACFNPKIVHASDETIVLEEGCISFPGLFVKIKRPKSIRVRFQTPSGTVVTKQFDGLTARIFQHELDHLNGILFYNRANRYHREKALKEYNKNG